MLAPLDYEFTSDWFSAVKPLWDELTDINKPTRILEIGCYEGRSTVYLIERCAPFGPLHLVCVDTWAGSADLSPQMMDGVEERFGRNVVMAMCRAPNAAKLDKRKEPSLRALAALIGEGQQFDFISIDGSHTAPDVLSDAVMAFTLLRPGGIMVLDDYTWWMEPMGQQDVLNLPKMAIDAFVNINFRKLMVIAAGRQLVLTRTVP